MRFVLILIICLSSSTAYAEDFFQSSYTNIQLLRGHDFKLGTQPKRTVVTLEHGHNHKYGDTAALIDFSKPDGEQYSYYGEITPRFSLSKMTGRDFSYGIMNDVLIATAFEKGKNQGPQYLIGGGLDFNIPGFKFFKTNAFIHDSTEEDGRTWQLTFAWGSPFEINNVKFLFEGFLDIQGHEGNSHPNQLTAPRFLVDVGDLMGMNTNKLMAGIEYQYWHNKAGVDGVTESVPQAQIKWTF